MFHGTEGVLNYFFQTNLNMYKLVHFHFKCLCSSVTKKTEQVIPFWCTNLCIEIDVTKFMFWRQHLKQKETRTFFSLGPPD
jgi:hypothetical protein